MEYLAFIVVYLFGFFTAMVGMGTVIFWSEIKHWFSDVKDRLHCKWIMWKYR
jgi:hypothetical protein